jgi:hypothetical protein
VVLLQPPLVKLQRLPSVQGAKDGYITPKACLSSALGRGFFFALHRVVRGTASYAKSISKSID